MIRTLGFLVLGVMAAHAQPGAQPAPAPATVDRYSRFVELTANIDKLNAELGELRKRYTDTHPEVRALRERLDGLRAQLGAERDGAPATAAIVPLRVVLPRFAPPGSAGRLPDNWWRDARVAAELRLTPGQVRQMEDAFQQNRLKLIDLNAALEKEEITLEPLVSADRLDEGKVTAQIDRVAQARAELEKTRGRMLVGIRKVLGPEQWRKLDEMGFKVTSR